MNFNEYQDLARKTAIYPHRGNNVVYPTLGLNGEAGEVAEKVKKMLRDDEGVMSIERREEVIKEMGDCLWYLSALCDETNTTLEYVAQSNIKKLYDRRDREALKGSGDNR